MRVSVSAYSENQAAIIEALLPLLGDPINEQGFLVYYPEVADEEEVGAIARAAGSLSVAFEPTQPLVDALACAATDAMEAAVEAPSDEAPAAETLVDEAPADEAPATPALDTSWTVTVSSVAFDAYTLGEQIQALRHGLAGAVGQ